MSIHSSGPKCHGNKCGYNASSPARCRNVSNKYGTMRMVCLLDNVYLASCAHVCVCVLVCLFVSQCHMLYDSHLFPAETHCSMMSSPQRRAQKGKESKIGKLLYIYMPFPFDHLLKPCACHLNYNELHLTPAEPPIAGLE